MLAMERENVDYQTRGLHPKAIYSNLSDLYGYFDIMYALNTLLQPLTYDDFNFLATDILSFIDIDNQTSIDREKTCLAVPFSHFNISYPLFTS